MMTLPLKTKGFLAGSAIRGDLIAVCNEEMVSFEDSARRRDETNEVGKVEACSDEVI